MTKLEIIELVILCVAAIGFVGYWVITSVKNGWISLLLDALKVAIQEAEKMYPEGHGEEKKAMVLHTIKEKCKELGIPYDAISALIARLIDKIINYSNIVNK